MLLNTSTALYTTQSTASTPFFPSTSDTEHIHEHHVYFNFAFVIQEIILGLIALFGTVGNALVCYTVIKQKQIKHTTWYYLCSLSITDFLVSIFNVPLLMYTQFDEDVIDTDTLLCQFNGFCLVFFFLVSVLTLAVISTHKFLYIKHPLYWRSRNQSLKFIAAVWLLSFAIAVGPFIGWSKYSHVHGHKQCIPASYETDLGQSYLAVLLFFGFFLPLTSMILCYTFVFMATRKHHKRLKRNSIGHSGESRSMKDWGIIKTIIIVVLTFCVCWTPFAVHICFNFTDTYAPKELLHAAFIMGYAQSAMNPIIYALRHKLFREHFKSIICCSTYLNMEVARDPSSTVAAGPAFTLDNQRSTTKLVHYTRKYSTQPNIRPPQVKQPQPTVTNKSGKVVGSPSGEVFLEKAVIHNNTPSSYFNGVFQLSDE